MSIKPLRVLVACERSAVVRNAFRRLGHDAWSCDTSPSEDPGFHYQGDVFDVLDGRWDLLIAHPPCTRLCLSGVRWLHERNLWPELAAAVDFFNRLARSAVPQKAIENPIPHGYASRLMVRRYDQIVHPWQFGHGEVKATCLWLTALPLLRPTCIVSGRVPRVHLASPGPSRAQFRSRTFQGIADAMASQWGGVVNDS